MKNYFRQILTSFTKNHYSEMIRQNFYGWLTDKEHAVEKDKALKEIWTTARAMGRSAPCGEGTRTVETEQRSSHGFFSPCNP